MVKRRGFPKENELVIAEIKELSQFAAWCEMKEYPHLKGVINISEAIGKWIYDIREVLKLNQVVVGKVLKIEEKENLVHLSLKKVSKEEEKEKLNEYKKEETAEKILELAAKKLNKDLEKAYEEVGYILQEKYGYLFLAFDEFVDKGKIPEKLKISEDWKEAIMKVLEEKREAKIFKISYEIIASCIEKNGIEKIKDVLKKLKDKNVEIKYLSAPRYLVKLITKNPKEDVKIFEKKLEEVKNYAKKINVEFNYKRND